MARTLKSGSLLRLPQVTIAAADCIYPDLTSLAMTRSILRCEFGDAIFFSDRPPPSGPYRWQEIPRLNSIQDYSNFCLTKLADFIKTDYLLVMQWDGYVVEPALWRNSFFKFDYIGAVFPEGFAVGRSVGNGGFSLRSRRLLDALRSFPLVPGLIEDMAISQLHRPGLEDRFGIRFAPERIAHQFSYDMPHRQPTFGFHGFYNMWRYLSDEDMLVTLKRIWQDGFRDRVKLTRLLVAAFTSGREALALEVYRELRRHVSYQSLFVSPSDLASLKQTANFVNQVEMSGANQVISVLESRLKP